MILPVLRAASIGLLLAGAAPMLAQTTAPAIPAAGHPHPMRSDRMHGGSMFGGGMFAGLSEAGHTTMRAAMRAGGDRHADRDAVRAARDRMLTALDAETLDTGALRAAMDDERRAVQTGHDKRKTAMLAGFARLSATDRKAFVASARAMRVRMDARVGRMNRRGPDEMPPPVM